MLNRLLGACGSAAQTRDGSTSGAASPAAIAPVVATSYPGGVSESPATLRQRPLLAFAGLARPEVFAATLEDLEVDLRGFQTFSDHHTYNREELDRLEATARSLGAGALVTTSKDWASLGERWEGEVPLWVLEVEARLAEPGRLLDLLERCGLA